MNVQSSYSTPIILHSKTTNGIDNMSCLRFRCFTDNITSTVQHYMEINEADQQITNDENICYTNLNLHL